MPDTPAASTPSILRRATAVGATLITLGLALGLVTGATALIAGRAGTEEAAPERAAVTVATTRLRLQENYEIALSYRGRVEAGQRVEIGFEAAGTLATVAVDEGDFVAKGTRLATLDTRALEADRAAQEAGRDALLAETELARRTAERQRALADRDHASAQRLDEAELTLARLEAEVRRADAALTALDIALEKAALTAPFDAHVGARTADPGVRLAPGQPILTLHEAVAPRLRVGVPAELAARLAPGDTADVEIDGRTLTATLAGIRADIDPATRTRDLLFDLPVADVATGALGTLTLRRNVPGDGAWVPTAALSEGVRGLWTVFVVEDGIARREAVEVVHTDGARAYVRGHLPDGAEIVTGGPHRIAAGQPVAVGG